MKAMILAAGFGTRLRPLTDSTPKPLLSVSGRPLIVWNLLLLRQHGVHDVIMNLHHLGDRIQAELGDGSQFGMSLSYSHEPVILGTGGGVKHVESFFGGLPFFILNGDTLIDLNLTEMAAWHRTCGGMATMALRDDPAVEHWGVLETDVHHRVLTITGRGWVSGTPKAVAHRRMFAGIHLVDPLLLRDIPAEQPSSIIDAYVAWMEKGARIYGFGFSGFWSDIGTHERYAQVQLDAKAGLLPFLADR